MLDVRAHRKQLGVVPSFKRVDTCAAEFEADTPYMYRWVHVPVPYRKDAVRRAHRRGGSARAGTAKLLVPCALGSGATQGHSDRGAEEGRAMTFCLAAGGREAAAPLHAAPGGCG